MSSGYTKTKYNKTYKLPVKLRIMAGYRALKNLAEQVEQETGEYVFCVRDILTIAEHLGFPHGERTIRNYLSDYKIHSIDLNAVGISPREFGVQRGIKLYSGEEVLRLLEELDGLRKVELEGYDIEDLVDIVREDE